MNSVIAQLSAAQDKNQLVNIYLNSGDIFYTGYVQKVNNDELVIATYESSGLADGYVAIKTSLIEIVETSSDDLSSIEEKMAIANQVGLFESRPTDLQFDSDINLFPQIIIQAYINHEIILIHDNDESRFYTGIVQKINNESFDFYRLDKFNFIDNQVATMGFNQSIRLQANSTDSLSTIVKPNFALEDVK